jgi:hypothetical protein
MANIRKQTFTVEVYTKKVDGCGECIPPFTEGEVRAALSKALDRYDSVTVEENK